MGEYIECDSIYRIFFCFCKRKYIASPNGDIFPYTNCSLRNSFDICGFCRIRCLHASRSQTAIAAAAVTAGAARWMTQGSFLPATAMKAGSPVLISTVG